LYSTGCASITITVNPTTSITSQPSTGAQSVCLNGTSTALSVSATGVGLTYQWYSNTSASNSGGSSINGATSVSYTPPTTLAGTTYYYCVVTGTCSSATSSVSGAITVNAATAITSQPSTGTQSLCINASATALSVTATGASLTYQWYSNASASNSGGSSVSGATSASYTPATNTAGTKYYYCVVGGTCSSATSGVSGAITVNATTAITSQPSTSIQNLCLNGTPTALSVSASGVGLTYQWYSNTSASNSGGSSINVLHRHLILHQQI
jgi:hypothetical protein